MKQSQKSKFSSRNRFKSKQICLTRKRKYFRKPKYRNRIRNKLKEILKLHDDLFVLDMGPSIPFYLQRVVKRHLSTFIICEYLISRSLKESSEVDTQKSQNKMRWASVLISLSGSALFHSSSAITQMLNNYMYRKPIHL